MKKQRILLLDTGKEWGGGTNSMFELLKRIDRERFDITVVFYRNYRKGNSSDLKSELAAIGIPLELISPPPQPLWAKCAKELLRGPLSPWPLLKAQAFHAIERLWRINPIAITIAEWLRSGRFDLLYMNNQPSSNLEGYLASEIAKIPVVQHCRSNAKLTPSEVVIINRVADRIICVSKGVREALVSQGILANLCTVVHNAIDVSQLPPEPVALPEVTAGDVTIGSVGSLLPRKANDHIIRAVALVNARRQHTLHLILVGDGPERSRLNNLVAELGITSYVTFVGFQSNALAWEAALDIVVIASEAEGFPRAILEAMLLAKPVIASDVTGSRELVKHNISGLLYPFGNISKLAEQLELLADNSDLRRKMGQAGKNEILQNYSIELYIQGVESILGSLKA